MTYTITIKTMPISKNLWQRHWRVRAKEWKRWKDLIFGYKQYLKIPEATGRRRVSLTFHWADNRRRDPQNYIQQIYDGLTRNGLIIDDDSKYMEIGDIKAGEVRKSACVKITLTDC